MSEVSLGCGMDSEGWKWFGRKEMREEVLQLGRALKVAKVSASKADEVWQDCQGDLPEQGRTELGPSWGRAREIKVWL